MPISSDIISSIATLHREYLALKKWKESLITMIDEAELPEWVYNSNAIENSTLSLGETEKILLDMKTSRNIHVREVYEARNLSKVMNYMRDKAKYWELGSDLILFLHQMLLSGINDEFWGRWRTKWEYVRVGTHIAPHPEQVESLIESLLREYASEDGRYSLEKVSQFHLAFENIHPFCDGNGRIGRVLLNFQLLPLGFPMVILRFRDRPRYYEAFREYDHKKKTAILDELLYLSVMESLHKRLAYLKWLQIIPLADYARSIWVTGSSVSNKAKRQTIPAFREKWVWKIGVEK